MADATTNPSLPAGRRPWLGSAVSLGLLMLETVLLERLVGDRILDLATDFFVRRPYRKEIVVAAALTVAVLFVRVRADPAPFRSAFVAWPRILLQVAVFFLPLLAFPFLLDSGSLPPWLGDVVAPRIAMGLAGAWIASLALLVPGGVAVRPLVLAAAGSVGFVATAIISGEVFWNVTGEPTLRLVSWMLGTLAGIEVVRPEPFVIGDADFQVSVGFGCSGYQGIALITGLLAGYLWWFRRVLRFPQAYLLIPVGIVLSYLANAVRIVALILIGIRVSPRIAVDGFHSNAGWLAFLAIGLGMIWTTARMPFFTRSEADPDPEPSPRLPGSEGGTVTDPLATTRVGPSTVACLVPCLVLLAVPLVTGAISIHGSLDVYYPIRVVAVAATLWALRDAYGEVTFDPSANSIGLGVLVFVIWMILAPNVTTPDPEQAARLDPSSLGPLWGTLWVAIRFLGYVLTAPIAEELAFRGFLTRRLVSEDAEAVPLGTFTWPSFLLSSVAFGLIHQSNWIPGTIAGMAYAAALYHRRRIGDAIAAHAVTNALLGTYVIATGSWASWG
jgi:exosortase E/protease (VPEID-CTERM system)